MVKEIVFKAELIRQPLKPKSDKWDETAHKWVVFINGQEFDYYTGLGLRTARRGCGRRFRELERKGLTQGGLERLLEVSRAIPPTLDDVLYNVVSDAGACEMSFASWCAEFDYDTDSRKALETYEKCQQNGDKLRKAGVDIEAERERLKHY